MRMSNAQETNRAPTGDMNAQVGAQPNVWLRLTSSGWNTPQSHVHERERVRRSQLTSWIILGLLVADILLLPLGLGAGAQTTLIAVAVAGVGIVVAAVLNRLGFVTGAGALLIVLIMGAVLGAITGNPGGLDVIDLPALDLLVIATIVAASILPPASAFAVAGVNIILIGLDFELQSHTLALSHQLATFGLIGILSRPIALQVITATVAYLWVRGAQEQIRRADRAEEVAHLESLVADQKRALDQGVEQLTQAFVRAANGDYNVRVNIPRQNPLWGIGTQMNTFVQRLQSAGQANFELERTRQEAYRLASALDDWRAGRVPIWPAPSGTVVDVLIQQLTGQRVQSAQSDVSRPLSHFDPSDPSTWQR